MVSIEAAAAVAQQLQHVANVIVSERLVREGENVTVEQSTVAERPYNVNVHNVKPAGMDALEAKHGSEGSHRDEDGILRWVSAEILGVDVTWFRR